MIRYKKYQNSNKTSPAYQKWFARAVAEDTVGIDRLAQHMAAHNTPYSKGCIQGVLRDMVDCIKELLIEGKNVKIENLAIFSVGITTKGAESAKAFTPAENIKGCTLRCRPTGQLRPKTMKGDIQYKEYDDYTSGGKTAEDSKASKD